MTETAETLRADQQDGAQSAVTLAVCTTCRRGEDEADPRPGTLLLEAIARRGVPKGVKVVGIKCLSACSNGCSVALTGGPDRWTYVYGNLDPDLHPGAILEGAARYAQTEDGIVPWRERPEIFRKQSIARIPPQSELANAAAGPQS